MPEDEEIIAYKEEEINTLKDLELSCERDEAAHLSNVTAVKRAVNEDGDRLTAVTYKFVDDFKMGRLTILEYKTEVDISSIKAVQTKTKGETFICEGEAFVKGKAVKILVFREKPKPA